jgi:hypothetical protein
MACAREDCTAAAGQRFHRGATLMVAKSETRGQTIPQPDPQIAKNRQPLTFAAKTDAPGTA